MPVLPDHEAASSAAFSALPSSYFPAHQRLSNSGPVNNHRYGARNNVYPLLLGIILTALSLTACRNEAEVVTPGGSENPPPATQTPTGDVAPVGTPEGVLVTATIGPAGGILESADKRIRVNVPAGALTANQPLTAAPEGHSRALTIQYTDKDNNGSAPQ